jgi:hypothetical protein
MAALQGMAQESRDPGWATLTEEKMRRVIEATPSGHYSIRALECRQFTCAVEIASPLESSPPAGLQYPLADDYKAFGSPTQGLTYMFGYEIDGADRTVYVTDWIYFRDQRP